MGPVALLMASALGLAACSGDSGTPETTGSGGSAPAAEAVEITFAASMLGETQRGPLLQELIQEFNDSQGAVVVKEASIPFSSFGTTIATQMGGGGGPDLIAFDHMNFFAAVDAGLVASIDGVVDEGRLLPGNDGLAVDGTRYGVALDIGNYALIYNPDLVPTPPTTFEELVSLAKELTKDGVYGYAMRHTQAEEAGVWYDLSGFVYGFGGAWSDDEGNPTINAPETVEGVQAYKEIYDAGVIPAGAGASDYRKMFAEGQVAMMVDNGGVPTVVLGANADASLDTAPVPLPAGVSGQVMAVLGVNDNSDQAHQDAAKAFLGWLLEEEQQATIQGFLGGSTVATKVDRTATELEEKPWVEVFDAAGDTAKTFVVTGLEAQTPTVRNIVVTAVLNALQSGADIQTVLDDAQAQVEALK